MARAQKPKKPQAEKLRAVTVQLTASELAAISRAAVVVTASGEPAFINAAESALRKLREAAARHPDSPIATLGQTR